MFTSKLMVAESGEKVGTLDAGNKSYDFHLEATENGSCVVVTLNSIKKFKVYLTTESIPEITKKLVNINNKFEELIMSSRVLNLFYKWIKFVA